MFDLMFDTVAYLGTQEILIIAGVVVLLFGSAKIPQLAKGMGEGIREFKKSMSPDEEPVKAAPAIPATTVEEIKEK